MTIDVLAMIMVLALGFMLGFYISRVLTTSPRGNKVGSLIINTSNPEKDIFRFELSVPVGQLPEMDFVTFEVIKEDSM